MISDNQMTNEIRKLINEFKESINELSDSVKRYSGAFLLPDASKKFNHMTDEELESSLSKAGQGAKLALSILMKRRASEIRNSVKELKDAIEKFNETSGKYTMVLIFLSVIIGILTLIMALAQAKACGYIY
jgi:methyl-accepting chemotaxis protein